MCCITPVSPPPPSKEAQQVNGIRVNGTFVGPLMVGASAQRIPSGDLSTKRERSKSIARRRCSSFIFWGKEMDAGIRHHQPRRRSLTGSNQRPAHKFFLFENVADDKSPQTDTFDRMNGHSLGRRNQSAPWAAEWEVAPQVSSHDSTLCSN